jgi:hypothetical protein
MVSNEMGKVNMFNTIKSFFKLTKRFDPLIDGMYADQYNNQQIRDYILSNYQKKFPIPEETPETHPWKFDPLDPPRHWRFDPYYELWVKEQGR